MSKELEALECIKTAPTFMGGNRRYEGTTQSSELYLSDIGIIEKELKALEIIKKYAKNDGWTIGWVIEFWNMSEKEIKLVNEVLESE